MNPASQPMRSASTMLLLGIASAALAFLLFSLLILLDKSRLYPATEQRYDLHELYVGLLEPLCPKAYTSRAVRDFVACLPHLDS